MKLQEGVDLHFIDTDQFTTNRIRIRFAAEMSEATVAGRVLVANILKWVTKNFRLLRLFGEDWQNCMVLSSRPQFRNVVGCTV